MTKNVNIHSITDNEIFEKFVSKFPTSKPTGKPVLNQKDIDHFQKVWNKEFISYRGRYKKEHIDTKKENEYKNCLFRIFTYHWDKVDGFQLNMESIGQKIGKSFITVDRMILLFLKTGILERCHNYMAGRQTYFYHKNSSLFNHLYKSINNDYYVWIFNNHNNNIVNTKHNNISNVFTNRNEDDIDKPKKRGRKPKTYTPNFELLKRIEKEFLPIIDKLNKGQHNQLQIDFDLRFSEKNNNFTGRSHSFFCYTLNEEKTHKEDNTMIPRKQFMNKVGLIGYNQIYDIKSEVPRTTILSNTGIWKPDSYDFYTDVIEQSQVDEITRDRLKELYMRFNFDIGTDKELFNHYRRSRIFTLKHEYGMGLKQAKDLYYLRYDNDVEYTFEEWVMLKDAIKNIQGKSWGNLIFWWTSLIQVKTIYEVLKDIGIRIYNVYDGFYGPPEIKKKYLVDMVKQSASYVFNRYIKDTSYPYTGTSFDV
jgi:predicted transcriptional regulator